MSIYVCKQCQSQFNRRGKRIPVFCSLECKSESQRASKGYDRDWLYQKYIVEGLSTYEIAKIVNRDPKRVHEWLTGYDIPTRSRSWNIEPGAKPYHNHDWLYQEYIVNKRSAKSIANDHGVNHAAIYHYLRKFGMARRTISDARKVKKWGVSGVLNPMYGRKGALSPNWKGGSTPLRQAFYKSKEWQFVSKQVWQRDHGTCKRCGVVWKRGIHMHIHHIVSFLVEELRATPSNLIVVCKPCHLWIHSNANINKDFIRKA